MRIGGHMSIAGGLYRAVERGYNLSCETIQIFTKNATQWKGKELTPTDIQRFKSARDKRKIEPVIAHNSYLINLASPHRETKEKSIVAMEDELTRANLLEIPYLIIHPGSHMGKGKDEGLKRISSALNQIINNTPASKVKILLETTAGQGSSLGHRFEDLAELINMTEKKDRIGVCLDTCHIFAAGYDIRTRQSYEKTKKEFDRIIGINNLFVIHLNDSKRELGSKIDRHEHIGRGCIGIRAFSYIVNDPELCHIPGIIETPKGKDINGKDMYATDINKLKALRNKKT